MAVTVTMLQTRRGEDGSLWAAGSSYSASDAFAAFLITGNLATGALPQVPQSGFSPADSIALKGVVSKERNQAAVQDYTRNPSTFSTTYTGTGSDLIVTIGFVPDLIIVKATAAATRAIYLVRRGSWVGHSIAFDNNFSIQNGMRINDNGTVTIHNDASINTNGAAYVIFAYRDNGAGELLTGNYSGNPETTRDVRLAEGMDLAAALFKRDSQQHAVIALPGKEARKANGDTSVAATIKSGGTVTVGQGGEINEWNGPFGEGINFWGIAKGARSIYVTTYVGTGATKHIITPFYTLEAVLVFPRESTGVGGVFWSQAGSTQGIEAVAAATVGAQVFTAINNGRITLGTDVRANQSGVEYVAIAFRRSRNAAQVAAQDNARPLRSSRVLALSAAAYVNCGTSDTLKIDGPITLEWWGMHHFSAPTAYPTSATNNDNTSIQAPLIWRSNGADGVAGSISYGLMIGPAQAAGEEGNPLMVAVTDIFDLPQSTAGYDVDDNQPWCTGTPIFARCLQHIIVSHDGVGRWDVQVNGYLEKERDRDMTRADPPRPNIASGSGHTFVINGRKRTSTPAITGFSNWFMGARVYARQLSRAEMRQNYEALWADNSSQAVSDYREQWLAANGSGTSLPATVTSANNGTITGTYEYQGGDA